MIGSLTGGGGLSNSSSASTNTSGGNQRGGGSSFGSGAVSFGSDSNKQLMVMGAVAVALLLVWTTKRK